MSPGIVILVLAVVVAVGFGMHRRRVDGRFRLDMPSPGGSGYSTTDGSTTDGSTTNGPTTDGPASTWSRIVAVLPDVAAGERATLVQFSSAFCAPCRTTRVVLADVAGREDGVAHVEVDAEQHLELVRELDVRRTPTTLVLDGSGREVTRAAGAPRREQVLAALPALSEDS